MAEIEKHAVANVNKVLVGNKIDLDRERKVSKEEGATLAKHLGMKFIETSAKSSANVGEAFKIMATDIQSRLNKTKAHSGKGSASYSSFPKGIFG